MQILNRNTGKRYATIQEAINDPRTLNGHEIFVSSGVYHEYLTINKSLSLVGEDKSTTIIDGSGKIKAVYVTANEVKITNFTIQNGTFGLWLDHSQNSRIIDNALQNGSYGIRLYHSPNTEVLDNKVTMYTHFGIELDSSGNSTLRGNDMVENKYNFGVEGNSLSDFINDIDTSNTINGKRIRYLINQHDTTIDSSTFEDLGYLALVNSTNSNVQNLNVEDNVQGILFAYTLNSTVRNVNAKENWNGIYVAYSENVSISGNNANGNFDYGIKFFNSPHSVAKGNNVDNNGWAGIGLFGSPNSVVDGNEASFNTYDLHLVYTNNSVITGNNARSKAGSYSIAVYYSHSNLIYHNAFDTSLLFTETRNRARFIPSNNWDNSLEGNYWNSYGGVDADKDGVGDTKYVVGENNTDNHPLMGKFSDFDVALEEKTYSVTIISNSTISQFEFTPSDEKVSFSALYSSETMGFSRIAIPNLLLQALSGDEVTLMINGEQPVLQRKWADETHTYWYFSYVNNVPESTINPWIFVAAASVILIVLATVFVILKRKTWTKSKIAPEKSVD